MSISTVGAVIIAEIPVVTSLAAAAVGSVIRRLFKITDELDAGQASHAVDLANITARTTGLEVLTAAHDRRLPTLAENLAVLAAFVERHERWHERHDQGSHPASEG